jgi:hypothetical protein
MSATDDDPNTNDVPQPDDATNDNDDNDEEERQPELKRPPPLPTLGSPLTRPSETFVCSNTLSFCFESGWMDYVAQEADFVNKSDGTTSFPLLSYPLITFHVTDVIIRVFFVFFCLKVVTRQVAHLRRLNNRWREPMDDSLLSPETLNELASSTASWAQRVAIVERVREEHLEKIDGMKRESISPLLLAIVYCYHEV